MSHGSNEIADKANVGIEKFGVTRCPAKSLRTGECRRGNGSGWWSEGCVRLRCGSALGNRRCGVLGVRAGAAEVLQFGWQEGEFAGERADLIFKRLHTRVFGGGSRGHLDGKPGGRLLSPSG